MVTRVAVCRPLIGMLGWLSIQKNLRKDIFLKRRKAKLDPFPDERRAHFKKPAVKTHGAVFADFTALAVKKDFIQIDTRW